MAEEEDASSPPANLEAEQALLAAILVNNTAFHRVSDFLRPEHFMLAVHGRIYDAASKIIDRGEIANPVSLNHFFAHDPALKEAGGAGYLAKLAANVVTVVNAPHYGRAIHDLYKRRQVLAICADIAEVATVADPDTDADAIIRAAEQRLYELSGDTARGRGPVTAAASAHASMEEMDRSHRQQGRILGVPSGITRLDQLLGGFQPGMFIVIGGRPSMGKTVLEAAIAESAARHFLIEAAGKPPAQVAEFSLEMSHTQLTRRRLSAQTGITLEKLKRGDLDQFEADQIVSAVEAYGRLPILTDDTPGMTLPEFRARLRRMMRQPGGIGLATIDHLQIMRASADAQRRGETAALAEITLGLKATAKEFGLPIIALSQLSRDLERRDDKRPMLADLRSSGSIEQDADVVIFIYREEYYLLRDPIKLHTGEKDEAFQARKIAWEDALNRHKDRAELIVAKQRDGATGLVTCYFAGATATIADLRDQREMHL